jgi:hypothetical protein
MTKYCKQFSNQFVKNIRLNSEIYAKNLNKPVQTVKSLLIYVITVKYLTFDMYRRAGNKLSFIFNSDFQNWLLDDEVGMI